MSGENAGEIIIDYEKMGHKIQVYRVEKKVEVVKDGAIIARTDKALLLYEDGHNPVYYIPKKEIPEDFLQPTDRKTTCPYKGKASYYDLKTGKETSRDSVWQYLDSNEEFSEIRDYVAFYPNSIDHINIV